jgi:hypothetical protein
MRMQCLEAVRKEFGDISFKELVPILKNHPNVILVESFEIPELGVEVKMFQFKETYVIYSHLPGLVETIGATDFSKGHAQYTFIREVSEIQALL